MKCRSIGLIVVDVIRHQWRHWSHRLQRRLRWDVGLVEHLQKCPKEPGFVSGVFLHLFKFANNTELGQWRDQSIFALIGLVEFVIIQRVEQQREEGREDFVAGFAMMK